MAYASPQTFNVLEYGPCGNSGPISLPLSRGFNPGMVLTIIASTSNRTGCSIKDNCGNILLYVNPRIAQNVVVFNSHIGRWGSEERPSQMPIMGGIKYCLHIAYESDGYRIFINGEQFHFYKHRIHNPATLLEINDGHFYSVSYKINEPKWTNQHLMCRIYTQEFGCGGKGAPHEILLQGRNSLSWIIISGIINCNATRVDFNLINSCGDINFHFNPRFTENCVVRNSLLRGGWGQEERSGAMVFQQNKKFIFAIDVEAHCYKTYIDGEEYVTYNHRKPANTITKLQILNDVQLFKIMYQK